MGARMLPPQLSAGVVSAAERRMFELLSADLNDDWTVLHSLGVAVHDTKPWTEIDFVLLGPGGVYCLEVKGGQVGRDGYGWSFTNKFGKRDRKREGPWDQAAGASAALRRWLTQRRLLPEGVPFGYGVIMPDLTFTQTGPDILPEVLYDRRDGAGPFGLYLRRLERYWRERYRDSRESLSRFDRTQLEEELRGDFDLQPVLSIRAGYVHEHLERLTSRQYMVMDGLRRNDRVVVEGAAGTGKTMLAVREAQQLARDGQRVLLLCYNTALAARLADLVGSAPGITALTMHKYMAKLVKDARLDHRLPPVYSDRTYTELMPKLADQAIRALQPEPYDAVIVDEAQDLLQEPYFKVLDRSLKGGLENGRWRLMLDLYQDVYNGVQNEVLSSLEVARPARFLLTENCRNTNEVAAYTSLLSGRIGAATTVEGPDVRMVYYERKEDAAGLVVEEIDRMVREGLKPSDIVVLSPARKVGSVLHRLEGGQGWSLREGEHGAGTVQYSTVFSFKGLEAPAVVVVDLEEMTSVRTRALTYVATSRARVQLVLVLHDDNRSVLGQLAEEFGRNLVTAP